METLMQMRNNVLKKLNNKKSDLCNVVFSSNSRQLKRTDPSDVSKEGYSSRKRLIREEDFDKISLSDFLKEQTKLRKKRKKNNTVDSSKNESKISIISKKHDKLSDFLRKHKTLSYCSKNSKDFRVDQSLSPVSKQKGSEGLENGKLKRKRKNKGEKDKVVRDEASQLQRRAQYLLVKLKLEQNLIDAYTGEGWKGQSREKIKPEKEIQRAKKQIQKCKLGIRDIVHQLDVLGSVGQIDVSLISLDGSVHHEHIFCKKCKTQEVSENNDIILCDGTCNCAFHQKCIEPPMATEDIPPEDEGWLCKYCDCKMDIIDSVNAHLGTLFPADSTWQDIFKEEALLSEAGTRQSNPIEDWPDDESDDNDYDPDSDSSELSSTSNSSCSFESEAQGESGLSADGDEICSSVSPLHQKCFSDSADNEMVSGPRHRSAVDYGRLYNEMFGKDTSTNDLVSEDEDWDPRKRRRKEKESAAASTLMALCENEVKHSDQQTVDMGKAHPSDQKGRKPPSRIPCDVTQKLRQAFAENELPSRDVKMEISKLSGLEFAKVNKWFKNARYTALKSRKRETSSNCSPSNKLNAEADQTAEPIISKCSSSLIPSIAHKKDIKWNANLTSLMRSLKRQRLKKTSLCNKVNMELSDEVSLKKLYLNAKISQKKKRCDNMLSGLQTAETQMEQLCHLEAKVWKLKQTLLTIQKATGDDSTEQSLKERHVVYIPIAVVKEKQ